MPVAPRGSAKGTMICLAACMALQMTSFVMILPLFARRFTELGAGVGALGASEMAYALAATICAPFMGALADRFGRRPFVLGPLIVYALAFSGYLLARQASTIILIRGLAGALTAGMLPAATSMVADLAPATRRAQWIGILSGGASVGWILGPILGGFLFDLWGFTNALLTSIGIALLAVAVAVIGLRETRSQPLAPAEASRGARLPFQRPDLRSPLPGLRASLTVTLAPIALGLATVFVVMFAWAFMEPRFMFYAYDNLGWSASMLGLAMSTYGFALMLGEFGLARLSDTFGRRPVIICGLMLFSAQFVGLALFHSYILIILSFVVAGLGNSLYDPALSAWILDLTPAQHQARILGFKSTAGSIGSILGPALIVLVATAVPAQAIFWVSASVVYLIVAATVITRPRLASDEPTAGLRRTPDAA